MNTGKIVWSVFALVGITVAANARPTIDPTKNLLQECFERKALILNSQGLAESNEEIIKRNAAQVTQMRVELFSISSEEMDAAPAPALAHLLCEPKAKKVLPLESIPADFWTVLGRDKKSLTPAEWELLQDWFKPEVVEQALLDSLAVKPYLPEDLLAHIAVDKTFLVKNPYSKLHKEDNPKLPEASVLELSGFAHIDEQVEELYLLVKNSLPEGATLVSTQDASALVWRMLDRHPEVRTSGKVSAWINWNGRLYGPDHTLQTPKLEKSAGSNFIAKETEYHEALAELRKERGLRIPGLGEGFPIYNVVSTAKKFRPTKNLREALVIEGVTYVLPEKEPYSLLTKFWKNFENSNRMPASSVK